MLNRINPRKLSHTLHNKLEHQKKPFGINIGDLVVDFYELRLITIAALEQKD